jgi:hypothetical protein
MTLKKYVNNSGFPLQLGLEHQIRSTKDQHAWRILYKEHSWKNGSEAGFIDLVLEDQTRTWLMNIECKRVLDTSWIFLVPPDKAAKRRDCKHWVTLLKDSDQKCFQWIDIFHENETYQSEFCVIPGQDPKSRPMLERTASAVVASTEALAREEAQTLSERYSNLRIYTNVIVTTANLKVCTIDPSQINLNDGTIEEAKFEDVPYLRFRKQLAYNISVHKENSLRDQIRSLISQKENTVFIVKATEFLRFLKEMDMPSNISQFIRNP